MKFWFRILVIILAFVGLSAVIKMGVDSFSHNSAKASLGKHSILQLDLAGVIINGKQFLENLKEYRQEDRVKAILIHVNSPGGAVGPSQEIYSEIKRTRDEFGKPVVCFTSGLMASGGYYASLGCDKIMTAPGALVGSIGVIMSFANLEKLYDWAKVSRFSITSGKFKDSGAEYRSMRDDEKKLFQQMIDDVYVQFKSTVKDSRPQIQSENLEEYTDGRVFTGKKAVEVGFADSVGTYEDAVQVAAGLAKLKKGDFELFEIPKKKRSIWDLGDEESDDTINGRIQKSLIKTLGLELLNQPVLLMPGIWTE